MSASPLQALVSPYVGIVRMLDELLVSTCDPPLPRFAVEMADDERIVGVSLEYLGGLGGVAATRDDAAGAALGEVAERYSLSYVPRERLVHATAAELGGRAVDPARFALFSAEQHSQDGFPFVPFTEETPVWWVDAVRVDSGEPAWVPAELVFLGDPVGPGEPRIGYSTTTGAACGTTPDEALLRALLELCERDAFMLTWAARLSPPLLDWSADESLVELERRLFARTGLRYAAVDLSSFHGLACVLGVVRSEAPGPALAVGAGTAATAAQAWSKGLSEAFATHAMGRRLLAADPDRRFAADGGDVWTLEDHVRFHAQHENRESGHFLDASPERVDVGELPVLRGGPAEQALAVAARIGACGSTAYAVDVTAPDVASLGVSVVKALAPEFCSLDVGHRTRFLGGSRLPRSAEVNPDPHPFP